MFGRNGAKAQAARLRKSETGTRTEPESPAAPTALLSHGGFFNGNVAKIREHGSQVDPRPVHRVEDMRLGAQR